jgi:hypothetical protein
MVQYIYIVTQNLICVILRENQHQCTCKILKKGKPVMYQNLTWLFQHVLNHSPSHPFTSRHVSVIPIRSISYILPSPHSVNSVHSVIHLFLYLYYVPIYVPFDYVPYFVRAIILGLVAFHHSWYFLSFFWLTITCGISVLRWSESAGMSDVSWLFCYLYFIFLVM